MSLATPPADRYREAVSHGAGAVVAQRLGLPRPTTLRRAGDDAALLVGPALVVSVPAGGGSALAPAITTLLRGAGAQAVDALDGRPDDRSKLGAVVVDASGVTDLDGLDALHAVLAPAVRRLAANGRVLVVGRALPSSSAAGPSGLAQVERDSVQAGLDGLVRTLAKELRGGASANLVRVDAAGGPDAAVDAAASTLLFFASARSAYVSGQVVHVAAGPTGADAGGPAGTGGERPLAGQVAVVTGAARGIGAVITDVLARAGAHVVGVDVPAAGDALARVVNAAGGSALALDITAPGAGERLARHVVERHGGADVVVHNAGITRDKLLVNMDQARWRSVLEVNLAAQLRLTAALLGAEGALRDGARVVAVSSTSGLAGNRGQANYATSKAGVAGMVRALAPVLAERGMTANAVAPGFIETEMTAAMPALTREVARRASSLRQGGLPVDVAQTIAWLADPASRAVTGQVVRVCGQNLVGA